MPSRQRTKDGTKRPSRVRHDRGLRADGSIRPAAQRRRAKMTTAERAKYGGQHTRKTHLERPFHEITGQGAGEGEGYALVSLRSGEHQILSGPLAGDIPCRSSGPTPRYVTGPLDFQICMAFLSATVPSDCQPVCWELDWLVAMMCKSLPRGKLGELVDREGRCPPDDPWKPRSVIAHGWGFDWLPAHYFSLRCPSGRSIRISDPHRFWGRDLAEALASEPGATDLESLMTRFRERCVEHNVVPRQWEGPGQGASKLMSDWDIKNHLSGSYRQ